jgi:hypothetical protein
MQARVLIAALIVSTTLFSGCLGGDDGSPASATTSSTSGTAAATTTPTGTSGSAGANEAPVALLKVLQNGTDIAAVNDSYAVDAGMNVTLDASGSSDSDGDELVFTWTVDDEELASDAAVVEVPLEAGNHTVDLVVSDGTDEDTASIALVSAGSASGPVGDAAIVTLIQGTFKQGDDPAKVVKKPFEVPAGAKQITVWGTWDDGVQGNGPLLVDIDLFLVGPDGKDAAAAETSDFEFIRFNDAEKLEAGTWNVRILPYGDGVSGAGPIPVDTDYTVKVIVWMSTPTLNTFKASLSGAVNVGTPADTAAKTHDLDLTATGIVSARLTWTNAASAASGAAPRRMNDYDLVVKAAGKQVATSGNGLATEFALVDAEPMETVTEGKWTFEVVPFEIVAADYTLEVEYA